MRVTKITVRLPPLFPLDQQILPLLQLIAKVLDVFGNAFSLLLQFLGRELLWRDLPWFYLHGTLNGVVGVVVFHQVLRELKLVYCPRLVLLYMKDCNGPVRGVADLLGVVVARVDCALGVGGIVGGEFLHVVLLR